MHRTGERFPRRRRTGREAQGPSGLDGGLRRWSGAARRLRQATEFDGWRESSDDDGLRLRRARAQGSALVSVAHTPSERVTAFLCLLSVATSGAEKLPARWGERVHRQSFGFLPRTRHVLLAPSLTLPARVARGRSERQVRYTCCGYTAFVDTPCSFKNADHLTGFLALPPYATSVGSLPL